MHHLFSSFPNGLQGKGLLLLRLTLAAGLFAEAARVFREPDSPLTLLAVADIPSGILLLIGLGTPVVAILTSVLQVVMLLWTRGPLEIHLLRICLGLCLAALGPGAWSIDARLFGRRRIEIKNIRNE